MITIDLDEFEELDIGENDFEDVEHPLPDEFTHQYWKLLGGTEIPGLALEYVDTLLAEFAEAEEFPNSVKRHLIRAINELSAKSVETEGDTE